MPRPILPNSPLAEASAEVRFHGDLSLLRTWGVFQRSVRAQFPKLLVPGAVVGTSPLLQALRLGSSDGQTVVMLAINSFAVATGRYESWGAFRDRFLALYRTFRRSCAHGPISRVGLRYINDLPPEFPPDETSGHLHPGLKLGFSGWHKKELHVAGRPQVTFETEQSEIRLRVTVSTPEPRVPEIRIQPGGKELQLSPAAGTRLDLDAYRTGELGPSQVPSFLRVAHELIEEAFLGLITESFHRYLRGEA